MQLTENCIWNSFRELQEQFGYRHIFLTGGRGSGKSTLFEKLKTRIPKADVITTRAVPKTAVFARKNEDAPVQIGAFDPMSQSLDNKMKPCMEGLKTVCKEIIRLAADSSDWVAIDEIGYLETVDKDYCEALVNLMDSKQVLAVIRKQELPFLMRLVQRKDAFVLDLDAPFGQDGCVVMASGMGKRFGGNKLMADFDGSPLIQSVLTVTEDLFEKRVVVTRHKDVSDLCENAGIQTVLHDYPLRSDMVRLGMEAEGMQSCETMMFIPSDQPLLQKETVMSLLLCAANEKDFIWRLTDGVSNGAPVIFPAWSFEELLHLPEGKGGGAVVKKYPEKVHTLCVQNPEELEDIDYKEDLDRLKGRSK